MDAVLTLLACLVVGFLFLFAVSKLGAFLRDLSERVTTPVICNRRDYLVARMRADEMYYDWLRGVPDQMPNSTFDIIKTAHLHRISAATSLSFTELQNIFK
jgi:hypothetical protein